MNLVTDRCRIRPYCISDLDALVVHANDAEVAAQLRDRFPHPYTHETGRAFLEGRGSEEPLQSFAIDVDGEAVGGIGVHPGDDVMRYSAEIGYWLGRRFWGRGIASAALGAVVEHIFAEGRYCRLHAHTFEGNSASQRVLKKCGFEREGLLRKAIFKNGRFLDVVLYGLVDEAAMQRIAGQSHLE
jgi:[ribosomal protein S5]-alanine N-acetyltransferase